MSMDDKVKKRIDALDDKGTYVILCNKVQCGQEMPKEKLYEVIDDQMRSRWMSSTQSSFEVCRLDDDWEPVREFYF